MASAPKLAQVERNIEAGLGNAAGRQRLMNNIRNPMSRNRLRRHMPAPSAPPITMNEYKNLLKSRTYKNFVKKQNGGKSRKSKKASRRRLTRRRR